MKNNLTGIGKQANVDITVSQINAGLFDLIRELDFNKKKIESLNKKNIKLENEIETKTKDFIEQSSNLYSQSIEKFEEYINNLNLDYGRYSSEGDIINNKKDLVNFIKEIYNNIDSQKCVVLYEDFASGSYELWDKNTLEYYGSGSNSYLYKYSRNHSLYSGGPYKPLQFLGFRIEDKIFEDIFYKSIEKKFKTILKNK